MTSASGVATFSPAPEFVLPDYDGPCLAQVLPSIAARLHGTEPALPIPEASRYVVYLVDGFGYLPVTAHVDQATWLAQQWDRALQITCGVPSTTATSLTSLGTGVPPGQHGVAGYTFKDPGSGGLVNALTWHGGPKNISPYLLAKTMYRSLSEDHFGCGCVSLARFSDSVLQQIAFDGTAMFGVQTEGDLDHFVDAVSEAVERHSVVYAYERMLDHLGHKHGVGDWRWLAQLAYVDDVAKALRETLPDDVCILITGDHGMLNVPTDKQIIVEDQPQLAGSGLIGGEPRLRQLYTDDAGAVAARWREVLGERAVVLQRDEAIAAGWFGTTVSPEVRPRLGDIVVAMRDDWAVFTRGAAEELELIGMHGSLTAAEMTIPLLSLER